MTKEEILNLKPGRELDAIVVEKVMGLGKINPHQVFHIGGQVFIYPAKWVEDIMLDDGKEYDGWEEFDLKPYSTDISAAWEVIEKFPRFEIEKNEEGIWCALMDEKWKRFVGYGDTVPEAIAKAALLAKEADA